MEVNEALVDKLAKLSRLRFNEEEKDAIRKDLERMISFVQKMDEVNTDEVQPLLHMSTEINQFRKDEVQGHVEKKAALRSAANHNEDFFLVPKVIKQ